MPRVFLTGSVWFIGLHLGRILLEEGVTVHGYDGMMDYSDVSLKQRRHAMLLQHLKFRATEGLPEDQALIDEAMAVGTRRTEACAAFQIIDRTLRGWSQRWLTNSDQGLSFSA